MKAVHILMALGALALIAPSAFADVGPSPAPPTVMVHMVDNGQPDTSVSEITYHCMGDLTEDTGAVSQRAMKLACSGGNCTNSGGWFYKFNPCFNFPGGFFTYEYSGGSGRSEDFNFSGNYTKYELTVDSKSGAISSKIGTSLPSGCCGSAFILAGIGVGALFMRRP